MGRLKIFSLLVCLGLLLSWPLAATAEPITLSFADQNSDISWGPVHATQPWAKRVEEVTKGRVKIQIYPNQTLCKGTQVWKAVKDGIADMGWFLLGYAQGLAPYADVITLPGLPFKTGEQGSEMLWKLYEKFPEMREQLAENKILILHTGAPMILLMPKKPVRTLEDLQGMKVRSHGGPIVEAYKKWGATPVFLSMPDCYMAMQKGTVDAIGALYEPMPGFRLHEVTKHVTENTPLNAGHMAIFMNKDKWNSLPKDIQDAIMSVSGLEGAKFFGRNFFDSSDAPVKKMIQEETDISIYTLPDEERQRWVDIGGKPVWEEWVKRLESQGHSKAQEILNAALGMM
jgi:TRAP-type C4-dicarboxylate transport system substrate-binding protein